MAIEELRVDDGVLRIRWAADQRMSRFPITWLLHNAYGLERRAVPPPPSDVRAIEVIDAGDLRDSARRAITLADSVGAALIRRGAQDAKAETPTWADAFGALGLHLRSFVTVADDTPVELAPYLPRSEGRGARYQGIHVISSHGGELLLADAHAAFDYLESVDIDAAQRLVATPVRDRERPHLPFPAVESWFRARDRFATIVRDPRHHYRVRVAQGDLVIYDSDRMLYGQTAGVDRVARVFQLTGDHEAIAPSAARSYIDEPETFFQDRSG